MKKIPVLLLLVSFYASSSLACPAYLSGKEVIDLIGNVAIKNIGIFVLDSEYNWHQIPHQIDIKNDNNKMSFPKGNNWQENLLQTNDRISFEVEQSETRYSKDFKIEPPCNSNNIVEISDGNKNYLYLVPCKNDITQFKQRVHFEEKDHKVVSPLYVYNYRPENHILFNSISISPKEDGKFIQAATDAKLNIYLNIKKFFSLEFTSKDVISRLLDWKENLLGFAAHAAFYWQLLWMKIDINLSAEVTFFDKSVHLPLSVTVPVEAKDYLHRGSGAMYTWDLASDVVQYDLDSDTIPKFDKTTTLSNNEELSKIGLKYCNKGMCTYSVNGRASNFDFTAYFSMPQSMVEHGFFPQLVKDEAYIRESLGWGKTSGLKKNRVGIYLEVSSLPKGQYDWEFWINVNKKTDSQNKVLSCPEKISLNTVQLFRHASE